MEERLKEKENKLAANIKKAMSLDKGKTLQVCEEQGVHLLDHEVPEKTTEQLTR